MVNGKYSVLSYIPFIGTENNSDKNPTQTLFLRFNIQDPSESLTTRKDTVPPSSKQPQPREASKVEAQQEMPAWQAPQRKGEWLVGATRWQGHSAPGSGKQRTGTRQVRETRQRRDGFASREHARTLSAETMEEAGWEGGPRATPAPHSKQLSPAGLSPKSCIELPSLSFRQAVVGRSQAESPEYPTALATPPIVRSRTDFHRETSFSK